MAFCTSCGAQMNGTFCTNCGAPQAGSGAPAGQPAQPVPSAVPSESMPAAPAAPKKRGVLFYGLIGCGGLIVIGILALVAGGLFVAHKAKEAGFDPELAKRNPTLAAAKMMVAVNPGLELVSSDDSRGTVTIREKKSGKTMTMNLEDIKRGRIVFEGDSGERMEIQGDSGGARLTTKEGNVIVGAGAKLPSWLPVYPGAKVEGGVSSDKDGEQSGSAALKTGDSQQKVADYYESAFKSAGLTVERQSSEGSSGSVITISGNQDSGNRAATAMVSSSGGQTTVALTFEAK